MAKKTIVKTYYDDKSKSEKVGSVDKVDVHTSYFGFSSKLFRSFLVICISLLFGSLFFTGVFNTEYTNNVEYVSYTDYNGTLITSSMVNYDWRKKINQLNSLKPVFESPNLSVNNDTYRTAYNRDRFVTYYNNGYINYSIEVINEHKHTLDLWFTRLFGSLSPIKIDTFDYSTISHFYIVSVDDPSFIFDNPYEYQTAFNWWNSEGQFIAEYFYLDENNNIQVRDTFYNNPVLSFEDVVNIIITPITWSFNFIYDLGVGFSFLIFW